MKLQHLILNVSLILSVESIFAQPNQTDQKSLPFLDQESQSNVVVTVCGEQPCPQIYTNILSNTNLFTLKEQKLIGEALVKYRSVTTNSGPSGAVLVNLYKTNYIIKAMSRTVDVENSVARFQYTNSDAQEEVKIGSGGILARFLTKSNDGYYVSITCVGGGSMLRFTEMKNDLMNGLLVGFEDSHAQGTAWDYRLADFSNSHLTEYRQYTNGMVFGKFLAWNSRNSDLILEADFKKPYDFEKHRVDLRILQQRSQ